MRISLRALVGKLFPFLEWWPDVTRETTRADVIAGLTGALVALPQAVTFAVIAGMPPQYGLYTAMVPVVIAALYGSSRHLVSGTSTAASIVLFSTLSVLAVPGSPDYVRLALTLTFMIGAIEFGMGLARLGVLANFISHSVVIGFMAGAAILIALSQLKNFFGVAIARGLAPHQVLLIFFHELGGIHPYTVFVGIVTLGTAIFSRRTFPRVPYMIVALLAGGLTAYVIARFFYVGPNVPGLDLVGALPVGLPPLSMPDFSLHTFKVLAPAAFAVTLFAITNDVSIARSIAARSGQLINGNRELLGHGLSNMVGPFFSAYVAAGSINRSGLNYQVGARTPMAAVSSSVILVVIVLAVAPVIAYLPVASMAAVLFVVAWGMVDFRRIHRIVRASRAESVVLWSTFIATLLLPLEFAILLGVILSLVVYLMQAARPRVLVRMPDPRLPRRRFNTDPSLPECPQIKFVRIDGALFFGAVSYVAERLRIMSRRNPGQKHLMLLMRSVNVVDMAGAEMIAQEARMRRAQGGRLYLHRLKDEARDLLDRGGYLDEIGRENAFTSKHEAISSVFARLDRGICVRCDKRIFNECIDLPKVDVVDSPPLPSPGSGSVA